ncbi:MAG: hypothetical protein JWO03_1454 [Bacteroidetes bacterium]|nr:hypothetical protein [Bacteroidota bacterium]
MTDTVMEKTNPGIFHIHIDFHQLSPRLDNFATKELGFYTADFDGHPIKENGDPYPHFEPNHQLTLKIDDRKKFDAVYSQIEKVLPQCPDFVGYIECEFIPIDEYISYREYTDIKIPFHITRRNLDPGKGEKFRQTEIHLTLDRDKSHPELIKKLLNSGLYAGYIPKKDHNALVFTVQGFAKEINPLIKSLTQFLKDSGGASRATVKEERVIAYKICNIQPYDLPEIADTVQYL